VMFWILVETWLYLCIEKLGWKWEKTSRLCLRTLFRSSHAKFLKSGDAAVLKLWRLPQTPWSKSTYFLTLPLGQKYVHYTLERNSVPFIFTFFPLKIISVNKKERMVDAWTGPVFLFC
jgi:hypothetical protein